MQVITEANAGEYNLTPGAVVFAPLELRPWIMATVAGIVRNLHGRLPRVVRMFVSPEKLIDLALSLLERRALPGSPSGKEPIAEADLDLF